MPVKNTTELERDIFPPARNLPRLLSTFPHRGPSRQRADLLHLCFQAKRIDAGTNKPANRRHYASPNRRRGTDRSRVPSRARRLRLRMPVPLTVGDIKKGFQRARVAS